MIKHFSEGVSVTRYPFFIMNKRILICILLLVGTVFSEIRPKLDLSGMVMVHAYADWNTDESKVIHRFESMLDLDFDLRFNERWSAWLEIEAMGMAMNGMDGMENMEGMDMGDGSTMDPVNPAVVFNGAYIQYTRSERTFFRIGDLKFFEGIFQNYYDFGDPRDDAAGISQKTIRGLEFQWSGLQLDVGFGTASNDQSCYYHFMFGEYMGMDCKDGYTYEIHAAYSFEFNDQVIRPYFDYKSYQRKDYNELYAGLDVSLSLGYFAFHGLYGFHSVFLASDDAVSNHVLLAEPSFEISRFCILGSVFYAFIDDPVRTSLEITSRPEYFFAAMEPSVAVNEYWSIGVPLELHTNSLDKKVDLGSVRVGGRFYFNVPDFKINIISMVLADIPYGDDWPSEENKNDPAFIFGVEAMFDF